jgi:integrase
MTRRNLLNSLAVTALALVFTASHANAQLAKDIVGTGTLVSAGDAYEPNAKGSLIFENNGRTSSHSGRRTFATRLNAKGVGMRTIQKLMALRNAVELV